MPPPVSRRALLRAAALTGGALVLAACEDTPADRVSPTDGVEPDDPATWPADTALLISARQRLHGYRLGLEAVGTGSSSVAKDLDRLWRAQQERLELLVTLGGVPLPELADRPAVTRAADTSSATADPSDATSSPTADAPKASDLGRVLRADRTEACRELSTATPANLLLLASLTAQHVASAARLGARVEWEPMGGPAGAAAVPVLAAARPAVFGLEVVAARSAAGSDERAAYEAVLEPLQGLTRQLSTLAGAAAPVAPLGYDLPEPLESVEERRELARALVADLAPAALDAAQRVPGDLAQLSGVVQVVSDATVWLARLGGRTQPFPGMTLP
ncbi:uncharacterized protein DUF4439 [Ornithinimicrobium humiphilum]|uniref:Uncharacterized protein DUF4439 n=2 Tax=Ornithinimicrobium humiphilum TaxID=125288 RepID=A0A543KQ44_9MICO|nr:uncharacterized protein DUF4439 [Ornithinimicrobium humiphilum]